MAKDSKAGRTGRKKGRAMSNDTESVRADDVPVTRRMLYLVRDELKADLGSLRGENKSIKGEIAVIKGEIASIKGEMASMRSEMTSGIHRIALLVEEQNARNAFVLDGLNVLFHRQDRIEKTVAELQEIVLKTKG